MTTESESHAASNTVRDQSNLKWLFCWGSLTMARINGQGHVVALGHSNNTAL